MNTREILPTLERGDPLYNSNQGPWDVNIGKLRFSAQNQQLPQQGHQTDVLIDETASSIWAASWSFATYVLSTGAGKIIRGQSVVELGSGTGLGGLAAAAAGANSVELTDLFSNLYLLEKAVLENQSALPKDTRVGVSALQWGTMGDIGMGNADASDGVGSRSYDVVLAVDCVYCPTLHSLLAATAVRVCKPGGKVLLVDEVRWKDTLTWWEETAQCHGLRLRSTTELPSHPRVPRRVVLREYDVPHGAAL